LLFTVWLWLVIVGLVASGCKAEREPSPDEEPAASETTLPTPEVSLADDPQTGESRQFARFEVGRSGATPYDPSDGLVAAGSADVATVIARTNGELQWATCLERAASAYAVFHPHQPDVVPPRAFVEFVLHWAGCPDSAAAVRLYYTTENGTEGLEEYLERI